MMKVKTKTKPVKNKNYLVNFFILLNLLTYSSCKDDKLTEDNSKYDVFSTASISKGRQHFYKCLICHKATPGSQLISKYNKRAPSLWGVYEREIASLETFKYSMSLKEHGEKVWDYENLDRWLKKPHEFAPQTLMLFEGIDDAQDRIDIIAYIRTLKSPDKPKQDNVKPSHK